MKDALLRMLVSMKVWTVILGGLASVGGAALAKWGLDLSDSAIQQIAGSIVVLTSFLVHAQGKADQGKAAAVIAADAAWKPVPAPPVTTTPTLVKDES